jgi:hypothetical protein
VQGNAIKRMSCHVCQCQVGGTVDNLEEMCATFVGRALGLKDPLIVTHQIDTCTEGWYVLIFHDQYHHVFYKY